MNHTELPNHLTVELPEGFQVGISAQNVFSISWLGHRGDSWSDAHRALTVDNLLQVQQSVNEAVARIAPRGADGVTAYREHERDAIREALDAITCGLAGAWESVDDDLALSSDDQAAVDRLQTILTAIENVYSPQYVQDRLDELHGRVVKVTGISDN